MNIFAIDPGTTVSGWCEINRSPDDGRIRVIESGVMENDELIQLVDAKNRHACLLAVEMIASYGMPVGREVFETCVYIGRLIERWDATHRLVYRKDVKLHLCGSSRAKDANIRQALLDKIGPAGCKKEPGPTYGVKSHAWAALAVATTALEVPA
jgi:hypothetical protein